VSPTFEEVASTALRESADAHLRLGAEGAGAIARAAEVVIEALSRGGKALLFGNGGSAADAQHIAAELVGRFEVDRRPLRAIALTTDTSILTAVANDLGFETIFARQVEGLGGPDDVAVALSASGRSPNVLAAVREARRVGMATVGLTGGDGGELANIVDVPIVVPSTETPRIQECHIAIGHILCLLVESELPHAGGASSRGA
jgi:D-sedoheptulose 7-phosphate isomerase